MKRFQSQGICANATDDQCSLGQAWGLISRSRSCQPQRSFLRRFNDETFQTGNVARPPQYNNQMALTVARISFRSRTDDGPRVRARPLVSAGVSMRASMLKARLALTGDRREKASKRYGKPELLALLRITLRQLSAGDSDADAACPKQKDVVNILAWNCFAQLRPQLMIRR